MGRLNPEVAAQWLEHDCATVEFRPVGEILVECLRGRMTKCSEEELAELAEHLEEGVANALEKRIADYLLDGIVPAFQISSDEGGSYFKALARPEAVLMKALRGMSPFAFEIFCKFILDAMKTHAVIEGGPYDGGVDFYGVGLSFGDKSEPVPPPARVFVIGQSKCYGVRHEVPENEVRSFVGGAIRKADYLRRNYPGKFELLTPLLLAFWTTSDFTHSAKTYAKELGIWYLNGIGLAQLATRLGLSVEDVARAEKEAARLIAEKRIANKIVIVPETQNPQSQ